MEVEIAIPQVSLASGLLLVFMLLFAWMMYRFNRQEGNSYNVVDLLIGGDKKASLQNHILLGMAMLAGWVVIDRETKLKDDVGTILLGVLGIFVAGKTATAITDIINKPPAGSVETVETTTTTAAAKTTVSPPAKKKA